MLFSSTAFLIVFLPLLFTVYFLCPKRFLSLRNAVLLVFSVVFYSFGGVKYTFLLVLSAMLNYTGGLLVTYLHRKTVRKLAFIAAVLGNLALLGFFKYSAFAVTTVNGLGFSFPVPEIVLPLGISFYTFQGMSYLMDVHTGRCAVQKNPLLLLLYIILFPQLVAGPIVNYADIEQELTCRTHSLAGFSDGVTRFMVGFGKKMILSGAMGEATDEVFKIPLAELPASAAWVGAFAYFFQIYFDFGGYSDMAIGLGHIFGFHFHENFNYPYIASSVTDFWRRWHISLSTWFRDYVYIPLGGNRCGKLKQIRNLLAVWFLTGLWHGANWTFIAWGLYYAAFLILEKFVLKHLFEKLPKPVRHGYTLLVVLVGWVFFRSASLADAAGYLGAMFGFSDAVSVGQAEYFLRQYAAEFVLCAAASFPVIPWLRKKFEGSTVMYSLGKAGAWGIFAISYVKLVTGSFNPFIYFHF